MSLSFLGKKSFHPSNPKNLQKLYAAEEKKKADEKKKAELEEQFKIDRDRALRCCGAAADAAGRRDGLHVPGAARLAGGDRGGTRRRRRRRGGGGGELSLRTCGGAAAASGR